MKRLFIFLGIISNNVEPKTGAQKVEEVIANVEQAELDIEEGILELEKEQEKDFKLAQELSDKIAKRSDKIVKAEKLLAKIKEVSQI